MTETRIITCETCGGDRGTHEEPSGRWIECRTCKGNGEYEVEVRMLAIDDLDKIEDAMVDAAQFIDAVRSDAIQESWWTDWDQKMRTKITIALVAIHVAKGGNLKLDDFGISSTQKYPAKSA